MHGHAVLQGRREALASAQTHPHDQPVQGVVDDLITADGRVAVLAHEASLQCPHLGHRQLRELQSPTRAS
jgi:hypothetical protein